MSILKALWRTFKQTLAEPEVQVFRNPERLTADVPIEAYQSPPPPEHVAKNEDGPLPDTKLLDGLHLIERRFPGATVRHVLDALRSGELTAWARPMKAGSQYIERVPTEVWEDYVYDFIFGDNRGYYGCGYSERVKKSGEKAFSRIVPGRVWPPDQRSMYYDVYLSTQEIDAAFPDQDGMVAFRDRCQKSRKEYADWAVDKGE